MATKIRVRCVFSHRLIFLLSLALAALLTSSAVAQVPTPPVPIIPKKPQPQAGSQTPPANPPAAHPLDAGDLGAFFDGIIPLQLERADIAGASVLVMKNDEVLLQKGYGFADAKEKKPGRVLVQQIFATGRNGAYLGGAASFNAPHYIC